MASRLNLKICADNSLEVLLGNGVSVHGSRLCRDVQFTLARVDFWNDFITLELGGVDVVLGVQWLVTLGKCEIDWKRQLFTYQGQRVILLGDSNLHCPRLSFKSMEPSFTPVFSTNSIVLAHSQARGVVSQTVSAVSFVLDKFSSVFALPTALPPVRGQEHSIILKPGVQSITVRPYQYPHSTKEIMEKMVNDMLAYWIIRHSHSPFSSPVLLMKKNDSSWRFCVDYRALN